MSGVSVENGIVYFTVGKKTPEAAILEKKRESGVPLFCVPRQRRSSQSENVSFVSFLSESVDHRIQLKFYS